MDYPGVAFAVGLVPAMGWVEAMGFEGDEAMVWKGTRAIGLMEHMMAHTLTPGRYLILLAVMLTASVGDTLLSHGMTQVGPVDLHHLGLLLRALRNPWVICGILCLLGFFASYLSALSWADLTFVLPATAFGYVVVALLSHLWLHEHVSRYRWAGILLIVCAVGFVANGPSLTERPGGGAEGALRGEGRGGVDGASATASKLLPRA